MAILLRNLFGGGQAGIAMALLSCTIFPGFHGLHWIVSSNMTPRLALLTWWSVDMVPREVLRSGPKPCHLK